MIDFNMESLETNAKILLRGMWYAELPDMLNMGQLEENIMSVLQYQDEIGYDAYDTYDTGLIKEYKNIASPSYLRSPGVEPITYYTFKKNKSFREMQIPNLMHYVSFVYNSLWIFDDLFEPLYCDPRNEKIVGSSNSYVVFNEEFYIPLGYEDVEEIELGVFTDKNNKIQGNVVFARNQERYDSVAEAYLYGIKMDIESFFPNIYTHYFDKIGAMPPYSNMSDVQNYFTFLDIFHQRTNNNQTKGIPAGTFSAHIAAELCMLCVDEKIRQEIQGEDAGYIRYVDDLALFADSSEMLEKYKVKVQKILNDFRLRINGNKTEIFRNARNGQLTNLDEISRELSFLNGTDECVLLNGSHLKEIKGYIAELLEQNRISQIKAVLSILLKGVEREKIKITDIDFSLFCYLQTLVFEDENLAWNVYKLMDTIMCIHMRAEYLEILKKKIPVIDNEYSDTLLQIWHYYIITKHMDALQKCGFWKEKEKGLTHPVIIAMFVVEGFHKNAKVFQKIKELFQKEDSGNDWKQKIIYSRWWLPLCKIRMVDEYNYEAYLQSTLFPKVLADLTKS